MDKEKQAEKRFFVRLCGRREQIKKTNSQREDSKMRRKTLTGLRQSNIQHEDTKLRREFNLSKGNQRK
jgi:hypothetical protein